MFAKKRSNKGAVWASIISIGATAAVWGMAKAKMKDSTNENIKKPVRNMLTNFIGNRNISLMNDDALTEFSEELINKTVKNKK